MLLFIFILGLLVSVMGLLVCISLYQSTPLRFLQQSYALAGLKWAVAVVLFAGLSIIRGMQVWN